MNNNSPTSSDPSSSLSHQAAGQSHLIAHIQIHSHTPISKQPPCPPCSPPPSPAIQPSPCPPPRSRTRFTNSQKHSLRRESRTSHAMHVGARSTRSLVSFHTLIPRRLASLSRARHRQRKVKCHQLPGQLKARPPPSTPRCPSLTVPGAFSVSGMPLSSPVSHHAHSHILQPRTALYGEKLSVHVRTSPLFLSPVRRQVNVRLSRHHAQQATSEKKRIATVNRRPRAYTSNAQPRFVSPSPSCRTAASHACAHLISAFPCHSPLSLHVQLTPHS